LAVFVGLLPAFLVKEFGTNVDITSTDIVIGIKKYLMEDKVMTDAISKFTRSAGNLNSPTDKANSKSGQESVAVSKPSSSTDEVVLSKAAASALAANDFDNNKVEQIKRQIAEGKYPLDSKVIAENFVALESMIE